jgi:polar amino acid transport system substrate-binding protein
VERRRDEGILGTDRYIPGIFNACWWAAATLATQADAMPRSPLGRVIAIIWMFTSVVFVASFTATVTTTLTVQRLEGDIRGPRDLPGRRVATTKGSTAAEYLRGHGATAITFDRIDQAYESLQQGNVDAVVYDSPILLYHAAHDGKGRVQIVGGIFRQESYGILLPRNSPHRKRINEALLRLREDGTYQQLYEKWFAAR